MELEDQFMMLMVMVSRTIFKEPERNLIDSIFQTTSSQLKTSTIPITETSQVMLEKQNTKEDQTIDPHTSTQNSVTEDQESMLDLNQEEMELTMMCSTKTASPK